MKKKANWEDAYFIGKVRRLPEGVFFVRFCSRHKWPWYQARLIVEDPQEMWTHFGLFKLQAEAHRRGL